jgi:hypothetical protein
MSALLHRDPSPGYSARPQPTADQFARQGNATITQDSLGQGASNPSRLTGGSRIGVLQDRALPIPTAQQSRSLSPGLAPVRAILKLQAFWGLSDEQLLSICGLPPDGAGAVPSALAKHLTLVDVKGRLRSVMAIRARLSALFGGDARRERAWLSAPWARLHNDTPLAAMMSGEINRLFDVEAQVREMAGG